VGKKQYQVFGIFDPEFSVEANSVSHPRRATVSKLIRGATKTVSISDLRIVGVLSFERQLARID